MPKLKTESTMLKTSGDLKDSNAAAQLYSFVERLERLDEEKQGLTADMKEVREEAKGMGYDTKIIGIVMRRRKMDAGTRQETDSMVDLYEEVCRQQAKKQTTQSEDEGE